MKGEDLEILLWKCRSSEYGSLLQDMCFYWKYLLLMQYILLTCSSSLSHPRSFPPIQIQVLFLTLEIKQTNKQTKID